MLTAATCFAAENITLNTKNTVVFRDEVNGQSTNDAMERLLALDSIRGSKDYPIYLVLDSPGGNIDDGLNFIAFASTIKNLKTITMFAASMAAGIVEALPGERLVTETSTLMFHRAKGGLQGQFEDGEMESRLSYIKKIVRQMEIVNAARMKMRLVEYKDRVKDEMWLYGEESIAEKAADRLIIISCSKDLADKKEVTTVEGLFSTMEVTFSGCPLFRTGKIKNESKIEVSK